MNPCEELEKDMAAILAAWTMLCDKTNDPNATQQDIDAAYEAYDQAMMGLMVKQGHPGRPFHRRRP